MAERLFSVRGVRAPCGWFLKAIKNDQRDLRKDGESVDLGETHVVEDAVLGEKFAYGAMPIYRQHGLRRQPSHCRQLRPRVHSKQFARRQ